MGLIISRTSLQTFCRLIDSNFSILDPNSCLKFCTKLDNCFDCEEISSSEAIAGILSLEGDKSRRAVSARMAIVVKG